MENVRDFIQDKPYLAAGLAATAIIALYMGTRRRQKTPEKIPCPANTVLLHTIDPGPNAPSMSPFPTKVESYCRLANIPYMREFSNPMSTKGKLPWITFNGEDVADSQFIIEYLNKKLGIDLNQRLSKEERAVAKAMQVLVDEHLYWCAVYFRWVCAAESDLIRNLIPSWFIRKYFARVIRKQLHGQGVGRHSHEEIIHIFRVDLQTLQDYLGAKPFLMGGEPTEVDCSLFGMLTMFTFQCSDKFMSGYVEREYPGLYQYAMRMKDTLYPDDWDLACKAEKTPYIFGGK